MAADGRRSKSDITTSRDEKAIQKIIERFAEGIRTLDANLVSSIFHPEALSFSVTARGICIEPFGAWPEIMRQAGVDNTHIFRERFSTRILKIDIAGTAAIAKVEWKFERARIIDFYNLLKTDDGWLITNQVYHTYPAGKAG